jgi:O-acetyl-ADP-ribose deacetylase (regulator of RNase III)
MSEERGYEKSRPLLDRVLAGFLEDSRRYRDMEIPTDEEDKRQLLRALMNIRMPRPMDPELLALQDAYLRARAEERGIVTLDEIPTVAESLGSTQPFADKLSIWQGDITRLAVDAIVNAANSRMLGCFQPCHSCIDNCIHTYAGVELREECDRQMDALSRHYKTDYEQPTAIPMLTKGYALPAKHVVHIVGPIVDGPLTPELEGELAACYRNTLILCSSEGMRTVAFCSISTGVFRFPKERACPIAIRAVQEWLKVEPDKFDRVIFTVFSDRNRELYEQGLR